MHLAQTRFSVLPTFSRPAQSSPRRFRSFHARQHSEAPCPFRGACCEHSDWRRVRGNRRPPETRTSNACGTAFSALVTLRCFGHSSWERAHSRVKSQFFFKLYIGEITRHSFHSYNFHHLKAKTHGGSTMEHRQVHGRFVVFVRQIEGSLHLHVHLQLVLSDGKDLRKIHVLGDDVKKCVAILILVAKRSRCRLNWAVLFCFKYKLEYVNGTF